MCCSQANMVYAADDILVSRRPQKSSCRVAEGELRDVPAAVEGFLGSYSVNTCIPRVLFCFLCFNL